MVSDISKAAFERALQNVAGPEASARANAERFAEMVARGQPDMPPSTSDLGTIAEKLITAQDAEIRRSVNDALLFTQQAQTMTMNELSAASIHTSLQLAGMQLDMEAKMGVVDSCKSSVETLMKNQ